MCAVGSSEGGDRTQLQRGPPLESQTLTKEQITANYKDVFKGLGHIGDTAIITDPLVKPTQWRRVPIALRDKVKEKLEDLESKGLVEKVTIPTGWISGMVVVSTPSEIRICLESQDLNKVVIRPKYQLPTLDELPPKLSKAKVLLWRPRMDFIRLD